MAYSELLRRYVHAEGLRRAERHRSRWEEAKRIEAEWRAEMVTPAIAATMLGVSRRTLDRLVAAGRIERLKLGDTRQSPARFRRRDIDAFKAALSGGSSLTTRGDVHDDAR